MSETANLNITYMEVGQSGKETCFNDAMDIIDAALPASLTIPLPVSQGGTGATSLTDGGLLVGNGTSPVAALSVGAAGRVLTGTGADPAFSATPTLGVAGATLGTLALAGNTSGTVTLQPQAAAGTYNFNLPTGAGTSGQPLLSGGGGSTAQTYGTLSVGAGGTGLTSYTTGDVLYASGSATLAGLADVAAGSYLRSGGVAAAPVWSTTTLPNSATTGDLLYASASNVYSNLADVATGQVLVSGGVGVAPAWSASPTLSTSLTCPTVQGSTSSAGDLNLLSTSHGTKGKIFLGTASVYDQANDRLGIGTTAPASKVVVIATSSDPSGTLALLGTSNTITLTANNANVVQGLASGTTVNQAGFNHTSSIGIRGVDFQVTASGSGGTVTGSVAFRAAVVNSGAGTLTTGTGFVAAYANSGGGTFGTAIGYDMPATTVGSTATYGYRGQLASAATRWNLYMDGTAQNYLAGFLGIGVTTPTNALSFGGNTARTLWMERHTTSNTAGNSLTIQSGGATSGATDKAPGALLLATGLGTGNAVPALVRLQGGGASATAGTTDQTLVDRYLANGFKVLTDAAATDILSCTLASGSAIGGVIHYTIEVTDGTDFQSETGYVFYSAVNKAGAVTRTITEAADSQQAVSAGTLTTTWAISNASPAVVSVNADTSLTPSTGYPRITFSLQNLAQQAVAVA